MLADRASNRLNASAFADYRRSLCADKWRRAVVQLARWALWPLWAACGLMPLAAVPVAQGGRGLFLW